MFRFEHMPKPWKYENNDLGVQDLRLLNPISPWDGYFSSLMLDVKKIVETGLPELKDNFISSQNCQNHRSSAIFICTQKWI